MIQGRYNHLTYRRGFTLVELMLGIIVTTIVLSALAVFTFGVGENWQSSDSAQSAFLAASMGVDRIDSLIRSSQAIDPNPTPGSLDNSTTPAACILWSDANLDGQIQYSELTVLQYDPVNHLVASYTIPATASNAATLAAILPNAATFLTFANVTRSPLIHDVTACQIFSIGAAGNTQLPSIEFILQMATSNGSSNSLVYTTATARAPNTAQ